MSHLLFAFVSERTKGVFSNPSGGNYGGIYAGYEERRFLKSNAVAAVVTSKCLCGLNGCSAFTKTGHAPDVELGAVVRQFHRVIRTILHDEKIQAGFYNEWYFA